MICKNCSSTFDDSKNFCPDCGAKVIRNRLTIRNLFDDFINNYLNYDNTFLKTFIALFAHPEKVINSYIKGTRKKYINVISYFTIAITLSGLSLLVIQKFSVDMSSMVQYPEGPIGEMQKQLNESIFTFITDYQSLIMILYIPLYALFAKLIFWNIKKFNYTELLVVFLYLQSQISISSAILTFILLPLGFPFVAFGMLLIPVQILYFAYGLKKCYNTTTLGIILKTLLLIIIIVIFMILLGILGFLAAILFKDSEFMRPIIESQKAAAEAQKAAMEAQKVLKDSIN